MTNHCATYRINYTARVNSGGRRNGVVVQRVRMIKRMSYRALIINAARASDPRGDIGRFTRPSLDRL